jgi:hypothetical protein
MKIPAPPPSPDELLERLSREPSRFAEIIFTVSRVRQDDYLPWDKMRFKKPPGDLTSEEWWLAISIARNSSRRILPLYDKDGRSFSYAIPDDVFRLTEEISRRASGIIAVNA